MEEEVPVDNTDLDFNNQAIKEDGNRNDIEQIIFKEDKAEECTLANLMIFFKFI